MADLSWSDDQWRKVKEGVRDAFDKASVSSQFLPRYGPLPGGAETVRNELLGLTPAASRVRGATPVLPMLRLEGDHATVNRSLLNLTVNLELSSEQVAEESLSNAMLLFRRAGSMLALEEDRIVFSGYLRGFKSENSPLVANTNPEPQQGLADLPARLRFASVSTVGRGTRTGTAIVREVVAAISRLENNFHAAPFACIMGDGFFELIHDPTQSLVLPADRIAPLLRGGPLLRSGMLDAGRFNGPGPGEAGIVVSLASNAVDIVVGTEPTVQFLQRTANAKFLFRVYERFVLRIRDANLKASGPPSQDALPVAGFRIQTTNLAQERAVVAANNLLAVDRIIQE